MELLRDCVPCPCGPEGQPSLRDERESEALSKGYFVGEERKRGIGNGPIPATALARHLSYS